MKVFAKQSMRHIAARAFYAGWAACLRDPRPGNQKVATPLGHWRTWEDQAEFADLMRLANFEDPKTMSVLELANHIATCTEIMRAKLEGKS